MESIALAVGRASQRIDQLGELGQQIGDIVKTISPKARAADGTDHAVLWVRRQRAFRVVDLGVPTGRVGSSASAISSVIVGSSFGRISFESSCST